MTYKWAGDKRIIIEHTEVDDQLKGKGIGKQLVTAAVIMAHEKKIKISPYCFFAQKIFEQNEDFADVLF